MAELPAEPTAEPVAVDTSLIDEMLRLPPAERLRQNDRAATLALKLRAAFAVRQEKWSNRKT